MKDSWRQVVTTLEQIHSAQTQALEAAAAARAQTLNQAEQQARALLPGSTIEVTSPVVTPPDVQAGLYQADAHSHLGSSHTSFLNGPDSTLATAGASGPGEASARATRIRLSDPTPPRPPSLLGRVFGHKAAIQMSVNPDRDQNSPSQIAITQALGQGLSDVNSEIGWTKHSGPAANFSIGSARVTAIGTDVQVRSAVGNAGQAATEIRHFAQTQAEQATPTQILGHVARAIAATAGLTPSHGPDFSHLRARDGIAYQTETSLRSSLGVPLPDPPPIPPPSFQGSVLGEQSAITSFHPEISSAVINHANQADISLAEALNTPVITIETSLWGRFFG